MWSSWRPPLDVASVRRPIGCALLRMTLRSHVAPHAQRLMGSADAAGAFAPDDRHMGRDGDLREPSVPAPRAEQRCDGCGYGIVLAGSPPRCPLCGSSHWTTTARPSRAAQELPK